jgi:hypothetical protein
VITDWAPVVENATPEIEVPEIEVPEIEAPEIEPCHETRANTAKSVHILNPVAIGKRRLPQI